MCPRKKNRTVTNPQIKRMINLFNQGWTTEKIANEVDRDVRTVRRKLKEEMVRDSDRPALKERHIRGLLELSYGVRKCLYDPRNCRIPDIREPVPLTIKCQSYIFDPLTWFYLCTPNFDEGHWGADFLHLKQHTKDSRFFEDYKQLKKEAERLQIDYEGAAKALSSRNRNFEQIWTKIQESRAAKNPPLRVPSNPDLELKFYPSHSDVHDDLLFKEELQQFIPDVSDRLQALESLLVTLNDDFEEDQINRYIIVNHCKKWFCKEPQLLVQTA